VRPNTIILPQPNIDSDLGLFGRMEPFSVEYFM